MPKKEDMSQEEIDAILAENKRLKEANETQQDVDLKLQNLEIQQRQLAALGEVNNALQKQFEIRDQLEKKMQAAALGREDTDNLERLRREGARDAQEQQELERLEAIIKETEHLKKLIAEIDKQTEGVDRLSEAQKAAKEEFDDFFTGIGTHFGLLSPTMNRYLETTTKIGELAKRNPKQVARAMRDSFSPTKLILGLTMQIYEATLKHALAVDKATAAFAAQTGAGRALTQEIASVGAGYRNLGIGAADAGKAAEQLFDGFTGFMQVSRAGREDLMQTVATLEKIGVSGQTAVASLELMTKNFSMGRKEATKMTKQLSIAGTKIGISSKKMMDGFVAASKSLAVYGKEAIKIYTDLAAQARAAGTETQTLLGIAQKFDTFSGAAEGAGKLNSILGTQISAIDMLTMKENERIETLIRSMQAQGRNFNDMDKYSQLAIANAAGITDMTEAQRIFSMSLNDYRKGLKSAQSEEEYNKRLKETMDIYKKLEKTFENFAMQIGPFVDTLANGFQTLLDWSQEMQGWPAIIVLGGIALLGFAIILAQLTPLLGLLGFAGPTAGAGIASFGAGAAAAAPGLMSASVAFGLMALSMALLFGAFALIGGPMTAANMFKFFAALAGGMLLFAGAMWLIGMMMPQIALASAVMGVLAGSLFSVGAALAGVLFLMEGEKLKSLGQIFSGLGNMMISFKVDAFTETSKFLDQIDDLSADIKPVLGDLALIATGKTTQDVTTSSASYNFNTFTSNFKNIFKPEITVKIGEKELRGIINEEISKNSMSGDN